MMGKELDHQVEPLLKHLRSTGVVIKSDGCCFGNSLAIPLTITNWLLMEDQLL